MALLVAHAAPAIACDPGATPKSDDQGLGWLRDLSGGWSKVSGDLVNKEPYVHTESGVCDWCNLSYSFYMLNYGMEEWAQIGPATNNNDYRQTLAQCNDGNGPYNYYFPAEPVQTTTNYIVEYTDAHGYYMFYVKGTEESNYCAGGWDDGGAQADSETYDHDDQVPGIVSSHEVFSQAFVFDYVGNGYDLFSAGSDDLISPPEGNWWSMTRSSGSNTEDIWDNRCP